MRLDAYLATYWPEHSRARWQRYCRDGRVKVNGTLVDDPAHMMGEDDEVSFELPEAVDFSQQVLPILYEDSNVIVINKPSGILTHAKGRPLDEFTVAEFMRSRTTDKPDSNRPGIVHRLDRATSGVIICAKNPETHSFLQRQFSDKKVKKRYVAVLDGVPSQPEAIVRLPIERNPKRPQTFRVGAGGKPSETRYKILLRSDDGLRSMVELFPTTGRTHQLRVHMRYLETPIHGDTLYNQAKTDSRLCLHAASLEITIPKGQRMVFEAPLPPDMKQIADKL